MYSVHQFARSLIFSAFGVLLILTLTLLIPVTASAQDAGSQFGDVTNAPSCGPGSLSGNPCVNTSGQVVSPQEYEDAKSATPTQCSSWSGFFQDPVTCVWRGLLIYIGSGLIYLAVTVLVLTGGLFNFAMQQTVIGLGPWFFGDGAIANGIVMGWTAFRDIANIAIIGMFVFIAINIILGNSSYGDKKLIARVLVVATLINFSFLFTKIVINVSGVTAAQVYNSTTLSTPATSANGSNDPTTQLAQAAKNGPAGKLMQMMGVSSISATAADLTKVSDKANSGWVAFGHGLLGATLILVTAFVFLYGSFILLTRAVLFAFLLVTASLAFATYLVPAMADGKFGWSAWWGSLLRNAALAPLLMLMLWVTMNIADAISIANGGKGTLGGLDGSPTDWGNLQALFNYLFIVGLLFASFKIASSLASETAGFAGAQKGIGAAFAIPAGIAGGTLSYGAQMLAYRANKKIDGKLATETNPRKVEGLLRQKSMYNSLAKAPNVMSSGVAKAVMGGIGLKGVAAGQIKVDYAGSVHKKGEELKKAFAPTIMNKERRGAMQKEVEAAVNKERGASASELKNKKDHADQQHSNAAASRDTAVAKRTEAATKLSEQKQRQSSALDQIRAERSSLNGSSTADATIAEELDKKEAQINAETKRAEEEHARAEATAQAAIDRETTARTTKDTAASTHQAHLDDQKKRLTTMEHDYNHGIEAAMGRTMAGRTVGGIFRDSDAIHEGMHMLEKIPKEKALRERIAAERKEKEDLHITDDKKEEAH